MNPEADGGHPIVEQAVPISRAAAVFLLLYYLTVMTFGAFGSWWATISKGVLSNNIEILWTAIVGAASAALLGSSISYSRKLYKRLMNQDDTTLKALSFSKHFGAFLYFVLRPLYAVIFPRSSC